MPIWIAFNLNGKIRACLYCEVEPKTVYLNIEVTSATSFCAELNMERACATLEGVHRKQNDMVEEYENSLRNKGKGNLYMKPLHSLSYLFGGQGDGGKGNMNLINWKNLYINLPKFISFHLLHDPMKPSLLLSFHLLHLLHEYH